MRQDNTCEPAPHHELISRAALPLLGTNEQRAQTSILSPAKRAALIACLKGDGTLHKRCGVWAPPSASTCEKHIFGVTVANLAREGMLTLTVVGRSASARLTP